MTDVTVSRLNSLLVLVFLWNLLTVTKIQKIANLILKILSFKQKHDGKQVYFQCWNMPFSIETFLILCVSLRVD